MRHTRHLADVHLATRFLGTGPYCVVPRAPPSSMQKFCIFAFSGPLVRRGLLGLWRLRQKMKGPAAPPQSQKPAPYQGAAKSKNTEFFYGARRGPWDHTVLLCGARAAKTALSATPVG